MLKKLYHQETLTVNQSTSDTSLILETKLSITSSTTFIDMSITTDATTPNLEPCLIYNSCNFCENDDCNPQVDNFLKNGTRLQDINRYSAHLEYECGLAKEFSSDSSSTPSISMKCGWEPPVWTPQSTIPECVCKFMFPCVLNHITKSLTNASS